MPQFKSLQTQSVQAVQACVRDGVYAPKQVGLNSPATKVMTDFHNIPPVTIQADAQIEQCHKAMIMAGVKSLIVADGKNQILGLVTAYDVMGEKPMQMVQERGVKFNELTVRDVMRPASELQTISMSAVETAEVGHIIQTLQALAVHYLLVTEMDGAANVLRGLFSAAQIGRQLNMHVNVESGAQTFAQIEAAVAAA
ncbi:CBS domain-containing protein [Parvibium lacunae]|uniref:CBS domain-containing protein n=1 Tax=Parvibium lacunae TaxID=1888893 RepID=A0A368L6Q4_9BURK|nr:CBS domain-containing protein [Parvibium lacunae]RCS59294.1 CBS domain-containing protein [Parvibium lacunae]